MVIPLFLQSAIVKRQCPRSWNSTANPSIQTSECFQRVLLLNLPRVSLTTYYINGLTQDCESDISLASALGCYLVHSHWYIHRYINKECRMHYSHTLWAMGLADTAVIYPGSAPGRCSGAFLSCCFHSEQSRIIADLHKAPSREISITQSCTNESSIDWSSYLNSSDISTIQLDTAIYHLVWNLLSVDMIPRSRRKRRSTNTFYSSKRLLSDMYSS